MILRSIEVKGWRCFPDTVRLAGFGERLNVVYGPNASGKSTLFQALIRALLDNYRVGGDDAATLRPWGRQLTPRVTVEFRHAAQDYRVTKQFLDRPSVTLERMDRAGYVSLAEAEAADTQLRTMLGATAPGRGLVQPRNWGLAQVLWTLQGDLNLRELTGETAADIRTILGAQFAGPGGSRLEQRIEALYGQFFNARGGYRSGQHAPEVVRLEGQLGAVREQLAKAKQQLQDFQQGSLRLEGIRAEKAQLARELARCDEALAASRVSAREYAELSLDRQRREGQAHAAEADYRRIEQQIESIRTADAELNTTQAERGRIAAALPLLRDRAASSRAEAQKRKTALENERGKQAEVDAARAEAALAKSYVATRLAGSALSLKLEQARELTGQVAAAKSDRALLAAPDAAELRSIRKAVKTRDDAQIKLDAALIQVELEPVRDISVTVLEGERLEATIIPRGIPRSFSGAPGVVLEIEGLGRLRARGPATNADELRQDLRKAEIKLGKATEPFGTCDLEALEHLAEKATTLEQRSAELSARLEGLLGDATEESVSAELVRYQNAAASIEADRLRWKDNKPDEGTLEKSAIQLERQVREAVQAAEILWTNAENLASAASTAAATDEARLDEISKREDALVQQLARLRSDGLTEEARAQSRARAAMAWEAARANVSEIERRLAEFPGDPAEDVKRLERQRAGLEKRERDAFEREKTEEVRLADTAAKGPYKSVAVAEEAVDALSARLAREQARASAIKLLWQTVCQSRTTAVSAVIAPVETAATAMLHRIAGGKLGRIRFSEGLMPSGLAIEAADGPIAIDDASGGEREQIFLATRLALADVLAREERQLVIFDDVLTATDTARMARITRLLDESADKAQIVILTCHPERYGALEGANFLDVEQAAIAASAGVR